MPTTDARLLVLLNPGRISRHYVLGIARAAERLRIPCITADLTPIWAHLDRAGDSRAREQQNVHAQFARIVRDQGITHVIGYGQTGAGDLGLIRDESGGVSTLFPALGVRHIMLWTDHPNWLLDGGSLDEPARTLLANPRHVHVVKSIAAADETAGVLRWPHVHSVPVGEDFESITPIQNSAPAHDVVAIIGGAEPLPAELAPYLGQEDPDPADIDRSRIPGALKELDAVLASHSPDPARRGACRVLADEWLAKKLARPLESFWRLSTGLRPTHGETLEWLAASPRRWYDVTRALRIMVAWRRTFYLAWLARRVDLGIYGASAGALGVSQPAGADAWVPYEAQARVYSRGRLAININAAWDEEGLTHKPFQIAASAAACVHHASRGISECFEHGREIIEFDRPAELLAAVRDLLGNDAKRRELGSAMRSRGVRDHTWEARLPRLLSLDA